jgi:CelD/BcsL family acetyltransferase involved in cellulose biosynthesis
VALSSELITTGEAFEALRPEWNDLVARMERPEVFHYWEWNWFYFRHYRTDSEPFIVVLRDPKGKLVGLAPFCLRRVRRLGLQVRVLDTIVINLADYRNVLVDGAVHRELAVEALLDLLHDRGDSWDLLDISQLNTADSTTMHLINSAEARRDWVVRSHFLTAVALRALKGRRLVENETRLRRLRNRKKNLQKAGYTFTIGRPDRLDLWPAFCDLHRKAWPSSSLRDSQGPAFFDDLRLQGALADKLEFSFVEFEGRLVAAHFGFVDAGKVYFYMPVMDDAFRQQRVGGALLCAMIEHYTPTHELFDFLRGTEGYKLWYTDELSMNLRLVIHRSASVPAFAHNVREIVRQALIWSGLPRAAVQAARRMMTRRKANAAAAAEPD